MKKKLSIILVLMLVLSSLVILAGCGKCEHVDANDDEKCDLCGETFKDGCDKHIDKNDNGKCDKCDKTYSDGCEDTSKCLDTDYDGKCDNTGCDKPTSNKKQCNAPVDSNNDGKCDTCGHQHMPPVCQHVDANDDGKCDKCEAAFTDGCDTPCVDENNDGKCDRCGETVEPPPCEHVDANDDGKCDKCEAAFTDGCDTPCVDENNDGKCDRCGETVAPPECQHVDADDDAKCDLCGESFEDGVDTFTVSFKRVNGDKVSAFAQGNIKVNQELGVFSADNLAAIYALAYRGIGVDTWYTDKGMTNPVDLTTLKITSDMELFGVPSAKAGLKVEYAFDEATGTLTFTGTGDMFKFQTANDVPWLKNGGAAKIKTVVIGEGITSLANNFIASAANVKTITFPTSLKTIGENAFNGSGLEGTIVLNVGIETIGKNAFNNVAGMTSVIIPNTLKTIAYTAFEGCSALLNVYYAGTRQEYAAIDIDASNVTYNAAVASFYMKDCPPNPGPYWYYDASNNPANWCYALKYYIGDAKAPEWVDYVFVSGAKATTNNVNFYNEISKNGYQFQLITPAIKEGDPVKSDMKFVCYRGNIYSSDGNIFASYDENTGHLKIEIADVDATTKTWDITDPEDVKVFAKDTNQVLAEMGQVKTLEISQGITYIGKNMFAGMTMVESVVIPASVTQIHEDAFSGCLKLKNIYYNNTTNLQVVNDNGKVVGVLNNCEANIFTKVLVGTDRVGKWYKIYEEIDPDTNETVEKYLSWIITEDGVLMIGGSAEMVDFASPEEAPWYIVKDSIVSLVILDGVVSLGENIVNGYEGIETVEFPLSLDKENGIPASALAGTGYMLNKAE